MADSRVHLFSNNASCLLGEDVDVGETSIQLETGKGDLFPDPSPGQIFVITVENLVTGAREIMNCTARNNDILTVERGQEGTDDQAWTQSNSVIVQNRVTADTLSYLAEGGVSGPGEVVIQFACSDLTTALEAGLNKGYVRAHRNFTLTEVRASLLSASSSGPVVVDINVNGSTILYPEITIDQGAKTSQTAATPPVITDGDIADDDEITIDIVTPGTNAKGLVVTLIGTPA